MFALRSICVSSAYSGVAATRLYAVFHLWLKKLRCRLWKLLSLDSRACSTRSLIGLKPKALTRRGCFWRCSSSASFLMIWRLEVMSAKRL